MARAPFPWRALTVAGLIVVATLTIPGDAAQRSYAAPRSYVVKGNRYAIWSTSVGYQASGIASWYGQPFHGRKTASGERYDMYALTAAHPHLPLPTWVRVTHRGNGRSIVVKVNDRGPFAGHRLIDLSYGAARALAMVEAGLAPVRIEVVAPPG